MAVIFTKYDQALQNWDVKATYWDGVVPNPALDWGNTPDFVEYVLGNTNT